MPTTHDIAEERASVWGKMKALNDKILNEKREYTGEEQAEWDAMEKNLDRLDDQVKKQTQLASIESGLNQPRNATVRRADPTDFSRAGADEPAIDRRPLAVKMRAMADEGMNRSEILSALSKEKSDPQRRRAWNQYLTTGNMQEYAGLQTDVDSSGGFLRAPEQFVARLIQDLDRTVFLRGLATVIPLTGAESLGIPALTTDISDTNWTSELQIGTMDTAMAFGKRRLTPHPLAKPIKVSKDLMRSAAINPESLVRERMNYKFGTVQEAAFMTGSGSGQPLGVFTASNAGISTSRDISTDNTSTAITADGLINARYGMESQWMTAGNLRWIFHRDAVKMIRKLKDGNGQYLWTMGLGATAGGSILDVPVIQSEYAPNTFTSGLYVGILGDFSYYWIVDAMAVEIQRLVELYAATNEDGFHGRMKLDGMPILENAFIRVKLG